MQAYQSQVHGSVPLSIAELRARADALFASVEPTRRPVWNDSRTMLTYSESSADTSRVTVVRLIPHGSSTDFELTYTQTTGLSGALRFQRVLDALVKSGCRKLLALIGTEPTTLRTVHAREDAELL